MKLKQTIIYAVNNVECRRRISERLNIGDQMLYKHLCANIQDGSLTKIKWLLAIAEEVGKNISEIVEYGEGEAELVRWMDPTIPKV